MSVMEPLPVTWSRGRHLTRRGVLWLGLRCDVRCKFCYDEHVPLSEKGWLGLDEAVKALEKFRFFYGNEFVDFMGGEPTLHPAILEIVGHAASIGLRPTVITHGMHLAKPERAAAYAQVGIHDFLVSIHGIGETTAEIHRRGKNNFGRQMQALDNLRRLGIPFRFNVTMIRDNLTQLEAIARLAGEKGARVVNFLTFNPYFEWTRDIDIDFQARHSEIVLYLARAIDACTELGVEANVRYLPPCQLPGREAHVFTGFQLPYDTHEWDYNSWYDSGHAGPPSAAWYTEASRRQQRRQGYTHVPACGQCAIREICDGFHAQYVARWGGGEAQPYPGPLVTDPCHFVGRQNKAEYQAPTSTTGHDADGRGTHAVTAAPLNLRASGGAGARHERPARR
jgi:MoaA/NifB/PqqE/SkfB family radical SAM enzyme